MAAKGTEAKQIIMEALMKAFPNSFTYGKEFRVPLVENGERIEIKIAMTCAKVNVGEDAVSDASISAFPEDETVSAAPAGPAQPTKEEIDNVNSLLERLGIH